MDLEVEEGDIVVGSAVKTVGYLLGWDVGESVHPEYGIRNGTNNSRIPNMSKSKQAIRFHSEIVERNVQVSISIKFIMPFDRNKTKYAISFYLRRGTSTQVYRSILFPSFLLLLLGKKRLFRVNER